jgi:hypothetical protein
VVNDERRNKIRDGMKRYLSDPENREAHVRRIREVNERKDVKVLRSKAMKERFSYLEERVAQSKRLKLFWSGDGNREKQSKRMKLLWSVPENREAQSKRLKEYWLKVLGRGGFSRSSRDGCLEADVFVGGRSSCFECPFEDCRLVVVGE